MSSGILPRRSSSSELPAPLGFGEPEHPLVALANATRYEQSSLIVSSNKSFSAWAEIFGDAVAVEAMVDRFVHHSHIIALKGDSYRLKDKQKEVIASEETA